MGVNLGAGVAKIASVGRDGLLKSEIDIFKTDENPEIFIEDLGNAIKNLRDKFPKTKVSADNDANIASDGERIFGTWTKGTLFAFDLSSGINRYINGMIHS